MRRSYTSKWTCISVSPSQPRSPQSHTASTWRKWFTNNGLSSMQHDPPCVTRQNTVLESYSPSINSLKRSRGGYWIVKLVLFLASFLCYGNSYNGDFVFDDSEAILNNKFVTGLRPFPGGQTAGDLRTSGGGGGQITAYKDTFWSLIENDFWGTPITSNASHKSWRPLTTFSFRLNYLWSANDSTSYHIMNILLHSIIVLLSHELFLAIFLECNKVAIIRNGSDESNIDCSADVDDHPVKSIDNSDQAANWAAIIFAVHPVHTECVSSIVGRAELLSCLFFLCSFLSYRWAINGSKKSGFLLSAVCALCAMLSKEQGITVLGVCFIYDTLTVSKPSLERFFTSIHRWRTDIRNNNVEKRPSIREAELTSYIARVAFLIVIGLLLASVRLSVMGYRMPRFSKDDNPAAFHSNIFVRVLNYNYIYALNAWLLLNPIWLCFDYSMGCIPLITDWTDYRLLSIGIFWIAAAAVVRKAVLSKENSRVAVHLALSIIAITYFPVSNIPFKVGFVLAERVLYLPSLGYCMLLGLAISTTSCRLRSVKKILFHAAIGITLIALVSKSVHRSSEWRSEEMLYRFGVSVCPLNAKAHYNLGIILNRKGAHDEAEKEYRTALRLYPEYDHALNNLGNLLKETGRLDEAEVVLEEAVRIRSDFPTAWMNLGIVRAALKKFNESETAYLRSLSLRPRYPDCYFNLGNLYVEQGRFQEALHAWSTAKNQQPNHAKAWINILILLDNANECEEAVNYGKEALPYVADDPGFRFTLANCLGKLERFEEAESHFRAALQSNPHSANYWANLGVLLHRWKRYREAKEAYTKALELDPTSVSIARNYKLLLTDYNAK